MSVPSFAHMANRTVCGTSDAIDIVPTEVQSWPEFLLSHNHEVLSICTAANILAGSLVSATRSTTDLDASAGAGLNLAPPSLLQKTPAPVETTTFSPVGTTAVINWVPRIASPCGVQVFPPSVVLNS